MKYVIGVDGGGTKTEGVAYDLDGNVLEKNDMSIFMIQSFYIYIHQKYKLYNL